MKSAGRGELKDPRGGLTKAGREWFEAKQGAHLKAGVKKSRAGMTPDEMRRKGSWAVRFYGRRGALPPLRTPDGKPTRFALTAAAWGEPVPKTAAAARRIAVKGRSLLVAYANATAKLGKKIANKQAPGKKDGADKARTKKVGTKKTGTEKAGTKKMARRKPAQQGRHNTSQ